VTEDYRNQKKRWRGQKALFGYIDTILSRLNLLIARVHVTIASTDAKSSVKILDNQTRLMSAAPPLFIDNMGRIRGIRKIITTTPED